MPDPQDPLTFERSRLSLTAPGSLLSKFQEDLLRFTARLAEIRRTRPALSPPGRIESPQYRVFSPASGTLALFRGDSSSGILLLANLSGTPRLLGPFLPGEWDPGSSDLLLDSASFFGTPSRPFSPSSKTEFLFEPFRVLVLSGRNR